jgi:methionyl-tRNA formyltransferase
MLRIAFAGTPEFALPALDALAASPHELVGVLTQPDRPAGRGRALTPSPVKQRALELGLPLAQPAHLKAAADRAAVESWRPELLVVVAYGLLLPPAVLELPRLGCLNIHASLLPRWRGAAPIQRALLAGDAVSGVSIMRLDAGLDTGPVYAHEAVPVARGTTSRMLHDALAPRGAALLLQVVAALEAGHARPVPQPAEGVTHAAKISREDALINWRSDALAIERQVCACNPWPVAHSPLGDEVMRIWTARAANADAAAGAGEAGTAAPGSIRGLDADGALRVACGSGELAVMSIQAPGKRPLGAAEFLRGRPLAGRRFG